MLGSCAFNIGKRYQRLENGIFSQSLPTILLTPYVADGPIGHTWREKGEKKLFLCVIFKVKLSVGPKKGQNSSYIHEVT